MKKTMKEGFSLVEIIVAIAILGLLSLPVLAYFTDAAVSTSRGKDTQKATLAAETVVEQVANCGNFEQVEDVLSTRDDWTLDRKADASDNKSRLTKMVTENGQKYQAKVTINYDYDRTNEEGVETDAKYNSYQTPELNELYSTSNVVLPESDQEKVAVSHFVVLYPEKTQTDIANSMKRELCIDMSIDPANSEVYIVKGYYLYTYTDGDITDEYDAIIEDTKIEKSKLKNIYFLYNLKDADATETVNVNYDTAITTDEAQKINIYYICQKKVLEPSSAHTLVFDTVSGTAQQSNYFTNGITCTGITADTDFIKRNANGKRIAKISVDIYDEAETTFNEDTRIVHLDTSKGER